MRHVAKRFAVVLQLSLVGVALVAAHASGRGGQSPLMPPQSHAFGKSFEEWNVLYSQWVIESWFGEGTDLSDTVGHVRFLPVPALAETGRGSCECEFEFDVTLRPGTPFVASPSSSGAGPTSIRPCPTTTRQTRSWRKSSRPPRSRSYSMAGC